MNKNKFKISQSFFLYGLATIITSVLIDAGGEGGIVWAQEISTQGTLDTTNQQQLQDLSNQVSPISIIIDNNREGWEQAIAYTSDPGGDNGNIGQIDWKAITLAHDCDDLYVRYEVSDGPAFTPDGFRYNLLVDVDNNPMTGYKGPGKWLSIGADVLIQGGKIRSLHLSLWAEPIKRLGVGNK
jgi:hypothetical protein